MFVHQHDTIGPLERRARRADVHTGWVSTMLAHHRQRLAVACVGIGDIDFSDPLGVGGLPAMPLQAVFPAASADTVITTITATANVDQHAPAHIAGDPGIGYPCGCG